MEISASLKSFRRKSKQTQLAVAEKLHVTRQTISQWENGKSVPDLDSLEKLSDLYHCQISELLGEKSTVSQVKIIKKDEGLLLLLITCVQFLMAPLGLIVVPLVMIRNHKFNSYYRIIYVLGAVAFLYNLFMVLVFALLFTQY